ncbi:hypothetical protein [Tropicibacter sp. S64]|uniref:hypothetical protein n=1 Tax=Tropicibacter sp. S64 TaxID=3415122 RepID=UPI003C7D50D7
MSIRSMVTAAILALSGTQAIQAATLHDEGVNGDLNFTTASITSAGVYTVKATTTRGFSGAATDIDVLDFTLDPTLQIVSASAFISGFSSSGTGTFGPAIGMTQSGLPGVMFQQSFGSTGTPTSTFNNLPSTLGHENFRISGQGGCGGCSTGASYTYSWQLDFTVAAISEVPLPASVLLLLTGLTALGATRSSRRRREPNG